jgi:hypothetical protein
MLKTERAVEGVRNKLAKRVEFDIEQAFNSCDNTYDGIVTQSDVSQVFDNILFIFSLKTYLLSMEYSHYPMMISCCSLTDSIEKKMGE